MFQANPELQIEIELLEKALLQVQIGETISYDALSQVAGHDVRQKRLGLIRARRKVEKETGLRFDTVRGEGVKKLAPENVAGIGVAARRTIAKKAKYASARLTGLRYNNIDRDTQQRIDIERSILGAISATAKVAPKKIEGATGTGPVVPAVIFSLMNRAD